MLGRLAEESRSRGRRLGAGDSQTAAVDGSVRVDSLASADPRDRAEDRSHWRPGEPLERPGSSVVGRVVFSLIRSGIASRMA